MASNTTMNVNLSPDLYKYVKAAVKSGRYTSASEVVRVALREKKEIALREVERKIQEGLDSVRRGEWFEGDAVMDELRARSRARRAASKTKS